MAGDGHRWLYVMAAGAAAAAAVGFFTGTRGTPPPRGLAPVPEREVAAERPEAPTYAALRERHGDNRLRHPRALAAMAADRPAPTDPVELDEETKRAVLAQRAERRSYEGAPPQIPHPIDPVGTAVCLACHRDGLRVEGRTAPAMSHELHASCTQCHVPMAQPALGDGLADGPPLDNAFEGLGPPGEGPRAWAGAPPQIPHRTFMREQCASCHGVLAQGIRTTHPWRQSCTQCHAPSAALDQVAFGGVPEASGEGL